MTGARVSMFGKTHICVLAVSALVGAVDATHATEPLYIGAGLGYARDGSGCDIVDSTTNTHVATSSCDTSSIEGKIYIGFRINELIGIELGYTGLRDTSVTLANGSGSGTFEARAIPIEAVFHFPGWQDIVWLAKIGFVRWSGKVNSNFAGNESDSGFSYVIGGGAEYNFSSNISVRAEIEYFPKVGDEATVGEADITLVGVSAKYSF
jgi:opacity protein-like surface antigen